MIFTNGKLELVVSLGMNSAEQPLFEHLSRTAFITTN
jgi:hypothetical protein